MYHIYMYIFLLNEKVLGVWSGNYLDKFLCKLCYLTSLRIHLKTYKLIQRGLNDTNTIILQLS
jgi:hypothetical protein